MHGSGEVGGKVGEGVGAGGGVEGGGVDLVGGVPTGQGVEGEDEVGLLDVEEVDGGEAGFGVVGVDGEGVAPFVGAAEVFAEVGGIGGAEEGGIGGEVGDELDIPGGGGVIVGAEAVVVLGIDEK